MVLSFWLHKRGKWYSRLNKLIITKTTWMSYIPRLIIWPNFLLLRERERESNSNTLTVCLCACGYRWTVLLLAAMTKQIINCSMSDLYRKYKKQWDLDGFLNIHLLNLSMNCSLYTDTKVGTGPGPGSVKVKMTPSSLFRFFSFVWELRRYCQIWQEGWFCDKIQNPQLEGCFNSPSWLLIRNEGGIREAGMGGIQG